MHISLLANATPFTPAILEEIQEKPPEIKSMKGAQLGRAKLYLEQLMMKPIEC